MYAVEYYSICNFFLGYKLAKYDRGPDSVKLKISPSGRIVWSPQMLQKLQEARQTAQSITARSGKKLFFLSSGNVLPAFSCVCSFVFGFQEFL